ncbi:uncharacterized protein B4U79_01492, partial [Dinothrombium tinctorium]
ASSFFDVKPNFNEKLCSADKARIGVTTLNNESIGFAFGDYFTALQELRPQIQEMLEDSFSKQAKVEFKFLEKNQWPITVNQESSLTVSDILINQKICIKYKLEADETIKRRTDSIYTVEKAPVIKHDSLTIKEVVDDTTESPSTGGGWRKATFKKSIKRVGTKGRVGLKFKSTVKLTKAHPIMLSYARQEASQHALNLKAELVKHGFSVYLDVHEIRTGTDWQDNLNNAVSNCLVFIPLITPVYGKTQWTNREVKLADILNKKIIPINFLDTWPPECLAIQFATTQYIPWKPPECEADIKWTGSGSGDISVWPTNCLRRVAKLIAEQIPAKVPRTPRGDDKNISIDGKPLIVFSAHPTQMKLVLEIKEALEEEGYNIWCSIESFNEENEVRNEQTRAKSGDLKTILPLTTISEENEITFNENIKRIPKNYSEKNTSSLEIPSKTISHPPLVKTMSTLSATSQCSMSSQKLNLLREFQEKVSQAAVVVVVASQAYYMSRTSRQHVYYCEHRKKVIVIQCDRSQPSSWFSMLLRNEIPLVTSDPKYIDNLKVQIKRLLNPQTKTLNNNLNESKIQYLVSFLSKNLPVLGSCVYVLGSTNISDPRTLEICKQIGVELAKVKNITLVTGGCRGASEILSQKFFEIRSKEKRPSITKLTSKSAIMNNNNDTSLVHVLPSKDVKDPKYKQTDEGNFESMPFGETLFVGESIKERDMVISRLLDTCILIEGDSDDGSVAQEFLWNDHYVIPIVSTGGAASGSYGLPPKIFECPLGVKSEDWNMLSNRTAKPEEVAKALIACVVQIKKSIVYHALSKLGNKGKPILRSNLRQSKRKRKASIKPKKKPQDTTDDENNSNKSQQSDKVLPIINLVAEEKQTKTWSSVVQFFSLIKK